MIVDPKKLSLKELEHLTRRFFTEIEVLIGPERDIPAPDVNTNAQVMAWFMDTYSMHVGLHGPGRRDRQADQPRRLRGPQRGDGPRLRLHDRRGRQPPGHGPQGRTVAVQGFGNAGSIAAQLIGDEGATVVAVSDSTAGIRNMGGLDINRVIGWKKEHGTVRGFPGAEDITNAEVLETECDILIPAALENQITARNAGNIKAKIVAEAANGPTTPEADEILYARGVFLIPDILCNAGGVTVSYFEWVQDLNRDHWTEAEVNDKLKDDHGQGLQRGARRGAPPRGQHADRRRTCNAVQRVADATAMRGLYP